VILANKSRNKARRNIGALPKHLPRCEQLIEPETTICPCCQGNLHRIGQDVSEVLDLIPAILAGPSHDPAQICLSGLRGHCRAGQGVCRG